MSQAFLAVEISSDGIRALSFLREKGRHVRIGKTAFRSVGTDDPMTAAVLSAVEAVAEERGKVHLYLPGWDFMARNMVIPFRGTARIRQVLPLEMGAGLGLGPDTCDVRFVETRKTPGSTEVLALALEHSRAEGVAQFLGDAGFFVDSVDVSHLAAARAVAAQEGIQTPWFFVDTRGCLVLMAGGHPLAMRMISGVNRGRDVFLQAFMAAFTELGSLRFRDYSPEAVWVVGPGSDSVLSRLEEGTGLTIRSGLKDPLWAGCLREDPAGASVFLAALAGVQGKAGLPFRERGWRLDQFLSVHGKRLGLSVLLTLVVAAIGGTHFFMDMQRLRQRDRALDMEIRRVFTRTLPDVSRIVDPLHQMRTHLSELEKASAFAASGTTNRKMVDLLKEIVDSAPEGAPMSFSRLTITGDQLTLTGETDTYNNVDGLKNRLDARPMFSGVTITRASAEQEEGRIQFNLRADIR